MEKSLSQYELDEQVYEHKKQFMNKDNLEKMLPMVPKVMFVPSENLMK